MTKRKPLSTKRPKRAKPKARGILRTHAPAHAHGLTPRFEFALAQPFNMAHGLIHTAEDLLDAITDPALALGNTTALRALIRTLALGIATHATTVYMLAASPRAFGKDARLAVRQLAEVARASMGRFFTVPAEIQAALDTGPVNGKVTAAELSAIKTANAYAVKKAQEYAAEMAARASKSRKRVTK